MEYGDKIVTAVQYGELIETDLQRAHELSGGGGAWMIDIPQLKE